MSGRRSLRSAPRTTSLLSSNTRSNRIPITSDRAPMPVATSNNELFRFQSIEEFEQINRETLSRHDESESVSEPLSCRNGPALSFVADFNRNFYSGDTAINPFARLTDRPPEYTSLSYANTQPPSYSESSYSESSCAPPQLIDAPPAYDETREVDPPPEYNASVG